MTGEAQRLMSDMRSRDASRITASVRELRSRLRNLEEVPVEAPPPDLLDVLGPVGEYEDDDFIVDYLRVVARYDFDPPLTEADRVERLVEAVLRHGSRYAASDLAVTLGIRSSKGHQAVAIALDHIGRRGVHDQHEVSQTEWLVTRLLDQQDVRPEAIRTLESWTSEKTLQSVLDSLASMLSVEERAQIGLSRK